MSWKISNLKFSVTLYIDFYRDSDFYSIFILVFAISKIEGFFVCVKFVETFISAINCTYLKKIFNKMLILLGF